MKDGKEHGIVAALFFAWLTHIAYCYAKAKYILLVAGAVFFPAGIMHGLMIWLGNGW